MGFHTDMELGVGELEVLFLHTIRTLRWLGSLGKNWSKEPPTRIGEQKEICLNLGPGRGGGQSSYKNLSFCT